MKELGPLGGDVHWVHPPGSATDTVMATTLFLIYTTSIFDHGMDGNVDLFMVLCEFNLSGVKTMWCFTLHIDCNMRHQLYMHGPLSVLISRAHDSN